jgi:hypothetical protein
MVSFGVAQDRLTTNGREITELLSARPELSLSVLSDSRRVEGFLRLFTRSAESKDSGEVFQQAPGLVLFRIVGTVANSSGMFFSFLRIVDASRGEDSLDKAGGTARDIAKQPRMSGFRAMAPAQR